MVLYGCADFNLLLLVFVRAPCHYYHSPAFFGAPCVIRDKLLYVGREGPFPYLGDLVTATVTSTASTSLTRSSAIWSQLVMRP